ncbi:LysR family transcriptional regulator [Magnetofaba australis]|uniref:Putative LysR family transcriptional regulator n=1 Tax=Magnetofaba australis IT-1 TaxID=1434232 RepID=A0A1Y2K0E1_9PROT|nr:LysR family transcriptional regulator [Magnetofaba australis]OSM01439.1 putative LysR family transcriptional regulator [Magnetofaba australis IT-1]
MNWDDLRIALAVAQAGSYARAAQRLRLDETTVARRIKRLERALGYALFDAVDAKRRPTPRGQEMLAQAAIMARCAQAVESVEADGLAITGRVRLSATPTIAEQVLAPALDALLTTHPGLILTLESANANADFARWETDFAIRLGRPQRGNFTMRKLGEAGFCLIRPQRAPRPGDYLCAYPPELAQTPEMQALQGMSELPPARLQTADLNVIDRALGGGRASAILPQAFARKWETDPNMTVEALAIRREAWLLAQPHLRDEPRGRVVSQWIVESFHQSDFLTSDNIVEKSEN